jgi:hypothetical protein
VTFAELKDYAWIGGLLAPLLTGATLYWLSQRFADKADTVARLHALETRQAAYAETLAVVKTAAESARAAATEATAAAKLISSVSIEIEKLRGDLKVNDALLKRLQHSNDLLTEGHLKI